MFGVIIELDEELELVLDGRDVRAIGELRRRVGLAAKRRRGARADRVDRGRVFHATTSRQFPFVIVVIIR